MSQETQKRFGVEEDKPNDWFERLYAASDEGGVGVPWANMAPHPVFKSWIDPFPKLEQPKTALVVGCGLGDDAIELETKGYTVTAFDVAESAIALCKKRFPNAQVDFVVADLLKGIPSWDRKFDLVLEIYTIQAVPPKCEKRLIQHVSDFVSENGKLVVITEIQHSKRTFENGPPWLLNHDYVASFEQCGLKLVSQSVGKKAEMGDEIHLTIFER